MKTIKQILLVLLCVVSLNSCSSDDAADELARIVPDGNTEILSLWNVDYAVINGVNHTYNNGFCEQNSIHFSQNYHCVERVVTNIETCFVTQYDNNYIVSGNKLQKGDEMFTILELSEQRLTLSSDEREYITSYLRQ